MEDNKVYELEIIIRGYGSYFVKCKDKEDYDKKIKNLFMQDWSCEFISVDEEKFAFIRAKDILMIKEHITEKEKAIEVHIEPPTNGSGDFIIQDGGKLIY